MIIDDFEELVEDALALGVSEADIERFRNKTRNAEKLHYLEKIHNAETLFERDSAIIKLRNSNLQFNESEISRAIQGGQNKILTELRNADDIYILKNVGLNVGLNKTEKAILASLIESSDYTADELAEKIGVTKRTIERTFASLQNKGKLERIGSKRDGRWIVIG